MFDSLKVNNLKNLRKNDYKLPYPTLARKIVLERLNLLKINKIPIHIWMLEIIMNFQKIILKFHQI